MTIDVLERVFTENVPNLPNSKFVQHNGDITPEWRIFLEALRDSVTFFKNTIVEKTTSDITQIIDVINVFPTDLVIAQIQESGVANLIVEKAKVLPPLPNTGQIELTFNVNPGADSLVTILIIAPKIINKFIP